MTSTDTTTAAPVYNLAHGGHPMDSPEYGVAGYDVIRSEWHTDADGVHHTTLTVTAVVDGATNYLQALEAAKVHRTGPGHYGYPSTRYACGCRSIAEAMADRPRSPMLAPTTFVDLPA